MSLHLINQIGKLLNSGSDLIRSMNTALLTLSDYLPLRNPILLIRDQVIGKFFIELAPEIREEKKNLWNQKIALQTGQASLSLHHQMLLYPGDKDLLQLPRPESIERMSLPLVLQPVNFKQNNLPLALLSAEVTDFERISEVQRFLTFLADMLALSMVAKGFPMAELLDSEAIHQDVPMVLEQIVGDSEALKNLAQIIKKVASSKATVLIQGESGTGKELIAKALHSHSLHRKAPFIGVNCAALSENLLESELFGHEKGAFTGANTARKGRFEQADGGTLFLDEIGDTPLSFQTKILRVLQEGCFERLGGNETIHVDVRILAATNVDLEEAIAEGSFREDLFYRLNVVRLFVPPLRDRREDIVHLVRFFLNRLNQQEGRNIKISDEALTRLQGMPWPGNIRELENAIHSGFLMEQGGWLHFAPQPERATRLHRLGPKSTGTSPREASLKVDELVNEEVQAIELALVRAKGVQVRAAEALNISLRQLRYRIQKYGIAVRKIRL